jgi:hypothetical protein
MDGEIIGRPKGFDKATMVGGQVSRIIEILAFLVSMTYSLQSDVLFCTTSGNSRRTT